MIEINEEIYRKYLAKYAYNHDWAAGQITEAFNGAKEAWVRLSQEELDDNFSETSTGKFIDFVNNVINDITSDSMPKAELVRGMFVALICTLREQRFETE